MAKANLGVLEFLKSIAWGSWKEKSKQGVDMIITPQPVVTITIMSMLSISAWMTKISWVWGTNTGKLSKINELHFTWAITAAAKPENQKKVYCATKTVLGAFMNVSFLV